MLKLAITMCDGSHVVYVGGDPVRQTSIIEIPDSLVPQLVREYLQRELDVKLNANPKWFYESISISIVYDEVTNDCTES